MNYQAIKAIYIFEMSRMRRTLFQSIVAPVISTTLYFVVFGAAIGSRITEIDGVSYGSFIVPGLIMLSILTESVSNASFGIYFPKFSGTIYEVLSAPISFIEITIGFVGAAATKSIIVGTIILLTANLFVSITILHPFWMIAFLVLTAISFSLLGFILGGVSRGILVGVIVFFVSLYFYPEFEIANPGLTFLVLFLTATLFSLMGFINAVFADSFDDISVIPTFVLTPLIYLGGVFYSINILPEFWRSVSMANPMLYVVNTFREGMLGISDVSISFSLSMISLFIFIFTSLSLYLLHKGIGIRE